MPHLVIELGRLLDRVGDFLAEQFAVALPEAVHGHFHRALSHLRGGGDFLHDDFIMSAALTAVLDTLPWATGGAGLIHQADRGLIIRVQRLQRAPVQIDAHRFARRRGVRCTCGRS